ncbi:hypothetical protein VTI28DRAFT_7491 [Corynascus sepedonium]
MSEDLRRTIAKLEVARRQAPRSKWAPGSWAKAAAYNATKPPVRSPVIIGGSSMFQTPEELRDFCQLPSVPQIIQTTEAGLDSLSDEEEDQNLDQDQEHDQDQDRNQGQDQNQDQGRDQQQGQEQVQDREQDNDKDKDKDKDQVKETLDVADVSLRQWLDLQDVTEGDIVAVWFHGKRRYAWLAQSPRTPSPKEPSPYADLDLT